MVERYVDIVEVISSILIAPTKNINFHKFPSQFYYLQKTLINIYPICLVIIAKGQYPIPFRIRKSSPSAPMVLCLKAWKSRTLPGLTQLRLLYYESSKFPKITQEKRYEFETCSKKGAYLYYKQKKTKI